MLDVIEYISYALMPALIIVVIIFSLKNKVPIYENFIEGSKESFSIILEIFPSMLSILLVINLFQVSRRNEFIRADCFTIFFKDRSASRGCSDWGNEKCFWWRCVRFFNRNF